MATTSCDLIVVGGGPGGYTAAIYGAKKGLNTVLIEADEVGEFLTAWFAPCSPHVYNEHLALFCRNETLVFLLVQKPHMASYGTFGRGGVRRGGEDYRRGDC